MPFHWAGEGRANPVTNPALDPVSGMPEFKMCAVRIEAEPTAAPGPTAPGTAAPDRRHQDPHGTGQGRRREPGRAADAGGAAHGGGDRDGDSGGDRIGKG